MPAEVVVLPKVWVAVSLDEMVSALETKSVPVVAPVVLKVVEDEGLADEVSVDEVSETFRPPWSSFGRKE